MSTGRGGGGAVDIPASTKKVVQDLKEVVGNSEEEIYAMLKECNMDPNEAAQRLLNQGDPFHEVKRKRDKKKETGGMKARDSDMRGRPGSGGYIRGGGRGGGGTGGSLPRYGSQGSQEYGGGRGQRTEERMAFILVCVVLAQLQIQLLHPVKQSRRPRALYHHQQALKQQQQQQQQHQFKLQVQLAVAPEEQLMEAAGL